MEQSVGHLLETFRIRSERILSGERADLKFTEARTILCGIFRMSSISLQILRAHILKKKYLSIFPVYTREPLRNEPGPFLCSQSNKCVRSAILARLRYCFHIFPHSVEKVDPFCCLTIVSKRFQESTGEEFLLEKVRYEEGWYSSCRWRYI